MANVGSVSVGLGLESAAFMRDMGKAANAVASNTAQMKKSLRSVESSARGVERSFNQLKSGAVALAGALAAREFVRFTKAALDNADSIAKSADAMGLTTKALQEYRVLANLSGVSTETLDKSVVKLTKNIGDARAGTGSMVTILRQSDAAFLQQLISTKSTSEALELMFGKLKNTSDAFNRNSLATAAFGREGAKLAMIGHDMAAGIDDATKKSLVLAVTLEENLIRQAEAVNDRMDLLKKAVETGFNRSIIQEFSGSFQITRDNIEAAREAGENFGRLVGVAVKGVAAAAEFAGRYLREIATILGAIVAYKAAAIFIGIAAAVVKFAEAMVVAAKAGALVDMVLSKSVLGVIAKLALTLGAATLVWQSFGKEAQDAIKAIEDQTKGLGGGVETIVAYTQAIKELENTLAMVREETFLAGSDPNTRAVELADFKKRIDLQTRGIALTSEQAKKEITLTRAIALQTIERDKATRATTTLRDMRDEVKLSQTEISLASATNLEREKSLAILKKQIELKNAGVDLTSEQAKKELALAGTLAESKVKLEEINKERDLFLEPFKNAIRGIQDAFAGMFESIFSGGVNSFSDLATTVKQLFIKLAAQIATLLVFRPVVSGILGGVGLGGLASQLGFSSAASGGTAGAATGGLGLGSIASTIGGYFAGGLQFVKDAIFNASTFLDSSGAFGVDLLGGGLGYGALGGLGAKLLGLGSGNALVDTGLGLGGTLLGTAIGGPIGGAIGSFLGTAAGGLFGGKSSVGPYSQGFIAFDPLTGKTFIDRVGVDNGASMDQARGVTQALSDFLNTLVGAIDLKISPFSGADGASLRIDQFKGELISFIQTQRHTDQSIGGNLARGSDPALVFIDTIRNMVVRGFASVDSPEVSMAIRNSAAKTLEAFASDLDFAKGLASINLSPDPISQTAQAIKQINDAFEATTTRARALGIAETSLIAARDTAIAKITSSFTQSIEDQIMAFTDPQGLALKQLADAQEARIKEARDAGVSLVLLERLNGLERQRVLDQFAVQAVSTISGAATAIQGIGGLKMFSASLAMGTLSALSPEAKFAFAKNRFDAAATAAASGDFSAVQSFPAIAEAFLTSAREQFGSGVGFVNSFTAVTEALNQIVSQGPDALTEQAFRAETRTQTDTLHADLAAVRLAIEDLEAEIRQVTNKPMQAA